MLSKKLFQKPRNDLETYERAIKESHPSVPDELCLSCPKCKNILFVSDLSEQYSTCPKCGHLFRMNARQRISMIADEDSFVEHDRDMHAVNVLDFPGYDNKLKHAALDSRRERRRGLRRVHHRRLSVLPVRDGVQLHDGLDGHGGR